MSELTPDTLDRTLKLELDEARAQTIDEAKRMVAGYRLQIDVGVVAGSITWQAALITAVATGRRAFPGGVFVKSSDDPVLSVGWAKGQHLSEAVRGLGGHIVDDLIDSAPVMRIAALSTRTRHPVDLSLTWHGWSAGLVPTGTQRLAEAREFPLAGIAAASLAVCELFQHVRGDSRAGHRPLGVSLWAPDVPWQRPDAVGQVCEFMPTKLWLIGLGHLGQAYAWAIGMLPYANPSEANLTLQDIDTIVEANTSTGVLSEPSDLNTQKTRVVAARLESLGFHTRILDRAFDQDTHPRNDDPIWALGGLDNRPARQWAAAAGFERYIDAGIGNTPDTYLDVLVQAFPSQQTPDNAFPLSPSIPRTVTAPAYEDLVAQQLKAGAAEGQARCGVTTLANRAVGASFVGTATASLALAQVLREMITGESAAAVISFNLRASEYTEAAKNATVAGTNPGYTTNVLL